MVTIDYVSNCITDISKIDLSLTPNTKFSDLCLDSLDFLELIQKIEKDFNTEIKLSTNIKNSYTISDFVHNINEIICLQHDDSKTEDCV